MSQTTPPVKNVDDSVAFRTALRREKLSLRASMDAVAHSSASACIEVHLEQLLREIAPKVASPDGLTHVIGFCCPVRGEFDAQPLVCRLLDQGWAAAVPAVEVRAAPMAWRAWRPGLATRTDLCGMQVPLRASPRPPDIVLMPLVAFDDAGYRLGYGGGYFDRTLADMKPRPFTIGVGFEHARVRTTWPQTHDLLMDAAVTELGVMYYHDKLACRDLR